MSLSLRADAVSQHQDVLTSLSSQHAQQLRALRAVYNCLATNSGLSSLLTHKPGLEDISDDEALFLEQNDISTGFDTTTLTLRSPPPTPQPHRNDASICVPNPTSDLVEAPPHVQQIPKVETPAQDVAAIPKSSTPVPPATTPAPAVQAPTPASSATDAQLGLSRNVSRRTSVEPDGPTVAPVKVATPMPEEESDLSSSTQQCLDQQSASRPAKTVHLPPEEVQEERLREREAALDERRRQSDAESKASQRLQAPTNELASSPSSTVGAYSAATPVPPQDSPDTSPDSEVAQLEVLPPKELQPTPEQQREKEEHDRLLEAQKEIARKQALGDVGSTPDEQLRWEEREAAAREAEERAAREDVGGPEPTSKRSHEQTEAEQAVEEMQVDAVSEEVVANAEVAKPTTAEASTQVHKEDRTEPAADADADTIHVLPRKPSLAPSTSTRPRDSSAEVQKTTSHAPPRPERMTTRVSSGAIRQKSVSEILGQSHSPSVEPSPLTTRKEVMSPEPISPMTQRHPQDATKAAHMPSRQYRALQSRSPNTAYPTLDQLDSLKGAAADPEKDYLEPLFRIQAHDSPNSGTKALPELIRMVPKALSTEDHFTSIHERADYKMLRRVYQLQNANKWSLRQMDKCKEPEQPVTHHDHMMQEMKWMRKDFKAERKMKKSVCAWLAQRCAEWVNNKDMRLQLQVKIKQKGSNRADDAAEAMPDLEQAGDSAPEDDNTPPTPRSHSPISATVVVAPELASAVEELRKAGKLEKALVSLPKTGLLNQEIKHERTPIALVSKFVQGKVLPKGPGPSKKRSRYDYEDEAEILETQPSSKRRREDDLPPEAQTCALFDPENKGVRDRLHSNTAFRPPSEFVMPSTQFYEFRSGSQWVWEDDQKLRKLAKEYTFNWSLIADEMTLPTRYKSSAERRTPWECFERWVELESLPADMRKTVYFKTWFQRLEQSQQAVERRYQAQVAALQQQAAQTGAQAHIPIRRRTVPTRVEKRRAARYLWMVDGFRKLAKKREQAQWKQSESARAAAQRKTQTESNQVKTVKMTPQEFSKKRHERDVQMAEAQRLHRAKALEAHQQRQLALARANQAQAQQQLQPNGASGHQRPQGPNVQGQQVQVQANGQQVPNANGQASGQQQLRPGVPTAPQRNGHLAPPQVNAQGIPQAPMQARTGMAPMPNMQQASQLNGHGGNAPYSSQQLPMPNSNMPSPGGNMTTQQWLQQNQALLQAGMQQRQANGGGQASNVGQNSNGQQISASPSMPPPPTPQNAPQQLSSGHVPQIIAIQNQLRANNPQLSDDQLKALATQQMKAQSQTSQARQNAMNAAAGISPQQSHAGLQQQFNQGAYQRNTQQMPSGIAGMYNMNGDGNTQAAGMSPANSASSPSQQMYAQKMWQRQQMQMQMGVQSPNSTHAQLNGSPSVAHASPNMTPASPSLQYSNMNPMGQSQVAQMAAPIAGMNGQRPPSRSATPQMQRLGSSGNNGVNGMNSGIQSPGALQGSPRNMQASMAR